MVGPAVGWMPVTPRKNTSALIRPIASWAAAPDATTECLNNRPPTMITSTERLLQHCDAVLRLRGASTGADQDVRIARERGLPVYERIEDVPGYAAWGRVRRSGA